MTLQALPSWVEYPSALWADTNPTTATTTMDAAGEGVASVLVAAKTGNIRKVGILPASVTSAQALDVRIETIAANGTPSGTLWAANTNGSLAVPVADTWAWVTLTADAAVTKGQRFCVNVQWAGAAGNLNMRARWNGGFRANPGVPYSLVNTGTWAKSATTPMVGLEYDDGTRPHCGGLPTNSPTTYSQTVNTGTTPDECGAYFRLPFTCKVMGIAAKVGTATAATFAIKLYDSDGSSVLASVTGIDSDQIATSGGANWVLFGSEVTLAANTFYRMTFLPETATSQSFFRIPVDSATTLQSWPGGADFYFTSRTDAGAWTEDQTLVPCMCLLISAIDDGASAGTNSPGASLVGGRLTR
jgi:hypothetical protein